MSDTYIKWHRENSKNANSSRMLMPRRLDDYARLAFMVKTDRLQRYQFEVDELYSVVVNILLLHIPFVPLHPLKGYSYHFSYP